MVNGTKIVTSIKVGKVDENECSIDHKKSAYIQKTLPESEANEKN